MKCHLSRSSNMFSTDRMGLRSSLSPRFPSSDASHTCAPTFAFELRCLLSNWFRCALRVLRSRHVSPWPLFGSMLKSGQASVLSSSTLITDDIGEHFGMIGATRVAPERVMAHTSKQLSDPTEEEALLTNRPHFERARQDSSFDEARCLDGSPCACYFRAAAAGWEHANDWVSFLQAGGVWHCLNWKTPNESFGTAHLTSLFSVLPRVTWSELVGLTSLFLVSQKPWSLLCIDLFCLQSSSVRRFLISSLHFRALWRLHKS